MSLSIEVIFSIGAATAAAAGAVFSILASRTAAKQKRDVEKIIMSNEELANILESLYADDQRISVQEMEFYVEEVRSRAEDSGKFHSFEQFLSSSKDKRGMARVFAEIAEKIDAEKSIRTRIRITQ